MHAVLARSDNNSLKNTRSFRSPKPVSFAVRLSQLRRSAKSCSLHQRLLPSALTSQRIQRFRFCSSLTKGVGRGGNSNPKGLSITSTGGATATLPSHITSNFARLNWVLPIMN